MLLRQYDKIVISVLNQKSLINNQKITGCVVQLDRISDFGSEGWGFESLRGHFLNAKTCKILLYRFFVSMFIHNF